MQKTYETETNTQTLNDYSMLENDLIITENALQTLSLFEGRNFQTSEIKRIINEEIIVAHGLVLRQSYTSEGLEQIFLRGREKIVLLSSNYEDPQLTNQTQMLDPAVVTQHPVLLVKNLNDFKALFREAAQYLQSLLLLIDQSSHSLMEVSILTNPTLLLEDPPDNAVDDITPTHAQRTSAVNCTKCKNCIARLGGGPAAKAACCSYPSMCPSNCPQC
jgi:hypothetical protein